MTKHPELPSLDSWIRQAVAAGFQHGAPGVRIANQDEAAAAIKRQQPEPHWALMHGYFACRAMAAAQSQGQQTETNYPVYYRQQVEAWALEKRPPMAASTAAPFTQDQVEDLEYITALATAEGYLAEGIADNPDFYYDLARQAVALNPKDKPFLIALSAYFGARTAAITQHQRQNAEKYPGEWFRLAIQRFLNEQERNKATGLNQP